VIDKTIWSYEKLAMATTDEPALRVVAWHMLKQALEQKLRERAAVNNDTWEVALDGKAQLCFDQAGLTLQPIRSLFGESVPGVTTLTVKQSVWYEGLWLELKVKHDTPLPLPLFTKLQARLAESEANGEASNEPTFEAKLDLEESLSFEHSLDLQEFPEWIVEMVRKTVEGVRLLQRH
jgi:hypothetical protein